MLADGCQIRANIGNLAIGQRLTLKYTASFISETPNWTDAAGEPTMCQSGKLLHVRTFLSAPKGMRDAGIHHVAGVSQTQGRVRPADRSIQPRPGAKEPVHEGKQ